MKILVCYNGSEKDGKVVKEAVKRAKAMDAKVYIVTSAHGTPSTPQEVLDYLQGELKKVEKVFVDEHIPCETKLSVHGLDAGEDLLRFADEEGVDEILIGIEKRSKVEKFLLGSTAQYVILQASCPVIAIG